MGYFPFFIDIENKKCLIVGGGNVALRKIKKLIPYRPAIKVVAEKISGDIRSIAYAGLELIEKKFSPSDIDDVLFIIAATDDVSLNAEISSLCRERGIPVNVVDVLGECGFVFPALLRRGALSAGVTTAGCSPSAAAWARDRLDEALPEGFEDILAFLGSLRAPLKARVPEQRRRSALLRELFGLCLELGRPLDAAELDAALEARA